MSLAKLHNFCIDETDLDISQPLACDEENLLIHGSGTVPLQTTIEHSTQLVPIQLMGGGHHTDDIPRKEKRKDRGNRLCGNKCDMPREKLRLFVENGGFTRPKPTAKRIRK